MSSPGIGLSQTRLQFNPFSCCSYQDMYNDEYPKAVADERH